MNNLLEHAKVELELAGYDITEEGCNSQEHGYTNMCAKAAYELVELLSKQGHTGMSVGVTLSLFNKLANWDILTPITNNPNEWGECSINGCKQNTRKPSCFSDDNLKTYYDIYADENYDIVKENGVEHMVRKRGQFIKHELKEQNNGK